VPVVVTQVGSMKFYVRHGYNGFFFEKGDSAGLARRIEELISDTDLRLRMGKYSRETIVKDYKWDRSAKEIVRILLNL